MDDEFELPDASYSVSYIKEHNETIVNLSIRTYRIENRVAFKIKTGYYLELLTPKIMKLLKKKLTKHKNYENVPHL